MREIVRMYKANNWGDPRISERLRSKGFLGYYESTGDLARVKIVDPEMIQDAMGYIVVYDWSALEPAIEHYRTLWKRPAGYGNFEWLKDSVKKDLEGEPKDSSTQASPSGHPQDYRIRSPSNRRSDWKFGQQGRYADRERLMSQVCLARSWSFCHELLENLP